MLFSKSLLAIYFKYISMYMSIPNKIETNNLWLQGGGGWGRDRQRG